MHHCFNIKIWVRCVIFIINSVYIKYILLLSKPKSEVHKRFSNGAINRNIIYSENGLDKIAKRQNYKK